MFSKIARLVLRLGIFIDDFCWHAVRDWWQLGYFVRDYFMGNY